MLVRVLERAGFTTVSTSELTRPVFDRPFSVMVRNVSLAPRDRELALRQLEETPLAVLRRTVLTTTSAVSPDETPTTEAFAVVRKPFNVDVLVDTVRRCRDQRRRSHGIAEAPVADDDDGDLGLDKVRRFVRNAPAMRALLLGEAASSPELLLRTELRRICFELSEAFMDAADGERDPARAAVMDLAARTAAEVGALRAPRSRIGSCTREH